METKIKLLKPLYIDGAIFQAGELKLVSELHARELLKKGYAVLIDEPTKQVEVTDEVKSETVIENGNKEEVIPVEPKKENTSKKQK